MRVLIIGVLCLLLISCNSVKSFRNVHFFKEWRKDTELFLSKIENKTELQKSLKEVINMELSTYDFPNYKEHFPKIEYIIFPEHIRVSMYKYERNRGLDISNEEGEMFVDSLFKSNIDYNDLKVLILTEKQKDKLPKKTLFYGFGSYYEGINQKNAKVILERPFIEKGEYYIPPVKIPYVEFNKALDTTNVFIYNLYHGTQKRYVKLNNKWKLDKIFEFK